MPKVAKVPKSKAISVIFDTNTVRITVDHGDAINTIRQKILTAFNCPDSTLTVVDAKGNHVHLNWHHLKVSRPIYATITSRGSTFTPVNKSNATATPEQTKSFKLNQITKLWNLSDVTEVFPMAYAPRVRRSDDPSVADLDPELYTPALLEPEMWSGKFVELLYKFAMTMPESHTEAVEMILITVCERRNSVQHKERLVPGVTSGDILKAWEKKMAEYKQSGVELYSGGWLDDLDRMEKGKEVEKEEVNLESSEQRNSLEGGMRNMTLGKENVEEIEYMERTDEIEEPEPEEDGKAWHFVLPMRPKPM
ncbi:hypothetical protein B0J11DRAFT_583021 [Dendryphion nanum]|uniref:Uncharacterized protein n=1 Tax=Dendryphion nanum TaxID=256645 RepID=A0A9P9DEE4_9PLEO|nr:hypothetical protein B0J11DRAFT_583021 [Dendryphion nanum]